MTIYRATTAWIPQARKIVRKFASGLQISEQEFLFPGTPTNPPYSERDNLDGSFVFPQPSILVNDAGISSSTVTAYGIWSTTVNEKNESKILKTGQATTITVGVDAETGQQKSFIHFQEFQYLAARVQTRVACMSNYLISPVAPGSDISGDFIQISNLPGIAFTPSADWTLSQYDVQNYGEISEVTYTYEIVGSLSRTINL
jgi:hypothetical protein